MTTLTGNSAAESQPHERGPAADTASELLVAELGLDDIAAVQATQKGKAREDAPRTDQDLALDVQATWLRALTRILGDRQFALSLDRAIEEDAEQLRRLQTVERAELDDHRAAVALDCGLDSPRQTLSQRMLERAPAQPARESPSPGGWRSRHTTEVDVEAINAGMKNIHTTDQATSETDPHQSLLRESPSPRRWRPRRITKVDVETTNVGTKNIHTTDQVTSETVPHQSSKNIDKSVECVICGDDIVARRSFEAPCAHYYCRDCIVNLVEASLRDESLHPLRCCRQPLPLLRGVFRFISSSLQSQFLAKSCEYSVPAASRVYCSNPRCSAFLDTSEDERRDLTCDECGTISCSRCKNNAHPGEGCFEHRWMHELRETATANKWQTCPGCHAIVELSQGCYHITCRCSTQFCYLCSARWKTCGCRQWDEERLLGDAERRVRNEFGNWAADARPAVHAERVYQRMEALRENHECQEHSWRYRRGCGQCEECGDFLPVFLMRCVSCQALVCRRCSVNRL